MRATRHALDAWQGWGVRPPPFPPPAPPNKHPETPQMQQPSSAGLHPKPFRTSSFTPSQPGSTGPLSGLVVRTPPPLALAPCPYPHPLPHRRSTARTMCKGSVQAFVGFCAQACGAECAIMPTAHLSSAGGTGLLCTPGADSPAPRPPLPPPSPCPHLPPHPSPGLVRPDMRPTRGRRLR